MKITRTDRGDAVVLAMSPSKIIGDEDAVAFHNVVESALRDGRHKIVVDLGDVSWLNSTGLGILIETHTTVSKQGGQVKLCRASKHVDHMLTITRLDRILERYEDEAQALASF